ncbi:D-alanine--D-alanine ligase [Psittacicella hinzii]|uniref:D-alanine--D-alanine ligase n=1 Tax=Psittacicella hinzii TaxID=2028575 RepID=A0A3A1YN56_9GAMM|nr:D-alanine--D-alanine ligase [Psittacicella hinzii]RIY38668.1 hypothetical protein CKF58_03685 [Psittacicella hinzii]
MKQKYQLSDLAKCKIAVLCGGTSNEREISLISGKYVYQALKESSLNLDVTKIDTKDYNLLDLKAQGYNLVFNILHGRCGEDGQIQGFLDTLGIKYTGCRVLQSALTLDKLFTKRIWQACGVNTGKCLEFTAEQILNQSAQVNVDAIVEQLGLPLFVKPNVEGSSIGITKVKTKEDLYPALVTAAKIDQHILVEAFIDGKEYSVPVLNGKALAPIEIIVDSSYDFYNYEAKYFADNTKYVCPAELSQEQTQQIQELAEQAARAVGIKSWCRVDVLSNSQGEFFALEVNTNPGMTTHSLFPMAAQHAGMSYIDLCLHILLDALNDVELS